MSDDDDDSIQYLKLGTELAKLANPSNGPNFANLVLSFLTHSITTCHSQVHSLCCKEDVHVQALNR